MTCNVHYSPKGFSGVSCVCSKYSAFHCNANTIALLLFRVPCGAIVVHNSGSEVPTHSVSGPICPKLTALPASPFSSCCFSLSSASLCVATLKAFVNWKIRLGCFDKKTIYWLIDWSCYCSCCCHFHIIEHSKDSNRYQPVIIWDLNSRVPIMKSALSF